MKSNFLENKENVRIHYLEWQPQKPSVKLPIICVHGNLSNARMYKWIGEALSSDVNEIPRHVVAIDLRGCGGSDMPERGFSLQHMATDIEAVMNHLGITKAHFIAYSRGVAYALQFALRNHESVQGMVIGDFSTYYSKFNKDWVSRVDQTYKLYDSWDSLFNAVSSIEEISRDDFEARKEDFYVEKEGKIQKRYEREFPFRLQLESHDCDLSPALDYINGQILVLKGSEEGSLLSEDQIQLYEKFDAKIVRVKGAGHDVFEPRIQVKQALLHYFTNSC